MKGRMNVRKDKEKCNGKGRENERFASSHVQEVLKG